MNFLFFFVIACFLAFFTRYIVGSFLIVFTAGFLSGTIAPGQAIKDFFKDNKVVPVVEASVPAIPSILSEQPIVIPPLVMPSIELEELDQYDTPEYSLSLDDMIGLSEIKGVPDDVYRYAAYYGRKYNIDPAIFLAIAWHERAVKHGWYDDYVFGYGAFDVKPWAGRFKGWRTQWRNAAPKIGKFFSKNQPTAENFQRFARDIYKTTAWKHYKQVANFYQRFSRKSIVAKSLPSLSTMVLGDSLAVPICKRLQQVIQAECVTKVGGGVTYQWLQHVAGKQVDKMFVSLGTNDHATMRKNPNYYTQQLSRLIGQLKNHAQTLYFLEIPVMPGRIQQGTQAINAYLKSVANTDPNVVLVATKDLNLERTDDQIHLAKSGNDRLSQRIINTIKEG